MKTYSLRHILTVILFWGVLVSCGIKTLPVPPDHKIPPAVENLSHRIDADNVILQWSLPKTEKDQQASAVKVADAAFFVVHRSMARSTEPLCETCPVHFRKIAEIPVRRQRLRERLDHQDVVYSYTGRLRSGFRYIYKVTVHAESGQAGSDSNYVRFEFEPESSE